MRLLEIINIALQSIRANKLRASLTILGLPAGDRAGHHRRTVAGCTRRGPDRRHRTGTAMDATVLAKR